MLLCPASLGGHRIAPDFCIHCQTIQQGNHQSEWGCVSWGRTVCSYLVSVSIFKSHLNKLLMYSCMPFMHLLKKWHACWNKLIKREQSEVQEGYKMTYEDRWGQERLLPSYLHHDHPRATAIRITTLILVLIGGEMSPQRSLKPRVSAHTWSHVNRDIQG